MTRHRKILPTRKATFSISWPYNSNSSWYFLVFYSSALQEECAVKFRVDFYLQIRFWWNGFAWNVIPGFCILLIDSCEKSDPAYLFSAILKNISQCTFVIDGLSDGENLVMLFGNVVKFEHKLWHFCVGVSYEIPSSDIVLRKTGSVKKSEDIRARATPVYL